MIDQIFLRNFKCFEEQAISPRSLALLTGLNGMGKSSVLQAMLLLRQSYLDGLLPETGLELNGSLVQMGTARDIFYEDAQTDDFEIGIRWDDSCEAKFVLQYDRDADVLKIGSPVSAPEVFRRPPFSDGSHYLQAERLGPRTTNPVSDYLVREHRQLGSAGEYVAHFLYVYGTEIVDDQRLHHPAAKANDLRNQVRAWLGEVSPGTEIHLDMHREMDVVGLRYSFATGKQRSNSYRSTLVGFGITYALPVLVAVLSAKPGDLLLIENPEAHLHPQGQAKMGELLARAAASGVQLLVETHSDHILNGVRVAVHDGLVEPEKVTCHYFSRIEEDGRVHSKVETPKMDRDGRLSDWPAGFFDEWEKSLERLLAPRGE